MAVNSDAAVTVRDPRSPPRVDLVTGNRRRSRRPQASHRQQPSASPTDRRPQTRSAAEVERSIGGIAVVVRHRHRQRQNAGGQEDDSSSWPAPAVPCSTASNCVSVMLPAVDRNRERKRTRVRDTALDNAAVLRQHNRLVVRRVQKTRRNTIGRDRQRIRRQRRVSPSEPPLAWAVNSDAAVTVRVRDCRPEGQPRCR